MRKLTFLLLTIALLGFTRLQAKTAEDPNNPIGSDKQVLVILIKYTNPVCTTPPCSWTSTTPRHDAATYEAVLNERVNDYYKAATYGQTTFQFHVPANPDSPDGWWDASKVWSTYDGIWAPKQNGQGFISTDAMSLASKVVDVTEYPRVLLIGNSQNRGGQSSDFYYNNKLYKGSTTTEMPDDNQLAHIVSHELGHTLGLPDYYCGPFSRCTLGNYGLWDIMDFDPAFNHFSGYSKVNRGWVSGNMIDTLPIGLKNSGFSKTVTLTPLSRPTNNASLPNVLRLPILEGPPFYGYYVECRRLADGEMDIPEEGLLITKVDESGKENMCGSPSTVVHTDGTTDHCTAPLSAVGGRAGSGQSWSNSAVGLSIQNMGSVGDGCVAQITYSPPGSQPDPAITPGAATFQYQLYTAFESPDIWLDSQKNGWDTYPAGQTVDDDGAPSGPGDVPWENKTNRIYVRVSNMGGQTATNVGIEIAVRQPIAISKACGVEPGGEKIIGTIVLPKLDPFETYVGYLPWLPETSAPAKVKVSIKPVPGELTIANNYAEETLHFPHDKVIVKADQPVGATLVQVPVTNPCGWPLYVRTMPVGSFPPDVPDPTNDWTLDISPELQLLAPGEESTVLMELTSPRAARPGAVIEIPLAFYGTQSAFPDLGPEFPTELMETIMLNATVVDESAVSCSVSPQDPDVDQAVKISGQLEPALDNEVIALEFVSPTKQVTVQNVVSEMGSYSAPFQSDEAGLWQVKAYWQGDEQHAPSESKTCTIANGKIVNELYFPLTISP